MTLSPPHFLPLFHFLSVHRRVLHPRSGLFGDTCYWTNSSNPDVVALEYFRDSRSAFVQLSDAYADPGDGRQLLRSCASKILPCLQHPDSFANAIMLYSSTASLPEVMSEENERTLADLFTVRVFPGTRLEREMTPTVQLVPHYFQRQLCIGRVEFARTPFGQEVSFFLFFYSLHSCICCVSLSVQFLPSCTHLLFAVV
jgi:hypothetical protein